MLKEMQILFHHEPIEPDRWQRLCVLLHKTV